MHISKTRLREKRNKERNEERNEERTEERKEERKEFKRVQVSSGSCKNNTKPTR